MRIVRPSPERVAALKREIAQRYRNKVKTKDIPRSRTIVAWRAAELTRLFDDRFGPMLLPANEAGELGAKVMAHHLGALRDPERRITAWFQACTPWLGLASRENLLRDAIEHRIRWRADTLGALLQVTADERDRLDLRTIGPCDQTREQRAIIVKQRKRDRDRVRRREQGAKLRAEYERWSITGRRPWVALGMSRADWYRKGRPSP